jgi:transposase
MPRKARVTEAERDRQLEEWAAGHEVKLDGLDVGQKWVVYAALTFLAFTRGLAPLRRVVAYLLCHCGMGLSTALIGAVVGTTGRAVRNGQQFEPEQFWKRLRTLRRGHAPPKLRREQVGPVAKFLAANKKCSVAELLAFIEKKFDVRMDRLTLRRFLKRYGLGCLREEEVREAPFLPAAQPTAVHSP